MSWADLLLVIAAICLAASVAIVAAPFVGLLVAAAAFAGLWWLFGEVDA